MRERDGSEHELRAKLVVAADGRNSEIAKLAGQATKLKANSRFGYFAHYREHSRSSRAAARRCGCSTPTWPTRFQPMEISPCWRARCPHKDRLPEFKDDPERAMMRLFERLPDGPRLDPAKRESKVMGKLDMPNVVRKQTSPGIAFIGDAALAADPVWGVGCGWALQSAERLADAMGPALKKGGEAQVDDALRTYARRHRKGLSAHEKLCSTYSNGRRFNPMEKLLYRGAARDRRLAARLALMGGRWITPQQMLTPGIFGRLLRVNLSRASRPRGLRTQQHTSTALTG